MAISWIYPIRGVQAVLAVTILGLMGYGTLSFCAPTRNASNITTSIIVVVRPLASVLTHRSKLPPLRALMDDPRTYSIHRPTSQILASTILKSYAMGPPRARATNHAVLVRRLRRPGGVFE